MARHQSLTVVNGQPIQIIIIGSWVSVLLLGSIGSLLEPGLFVKFYKVLYNSTSVRVSRVTDKASSTPYYYSKLVIVRQCRLH